MKKFLFTLIMLLICTAPAYADESSVTDDFYQGRKVNFMELYNELNQNPAVPFSLYSSAPESTLYYDQLTDVEKEIYDYFSENIDSTLNGTEDMSFICEFTISKNLSEETFSAEIINAFADTYGVDFATAVSRPTYALLYMDKPQYFWIDLNKIDIYYSCRYTPSTGQAVLSLNYSLDPEYKNYYPDDYTSKEQVVSDYEAMMAKAREIVASVPQNSSDWGKLNYYMNWLRENCEYNDTGTALRMQFLPVSALLYGQDTEGNDTENSPVCEGYAEALKILCDLSGINAMCTEAIYEENGKETGHKWNLIKLNNKFYHCDPTWFDNYNNFNSYRFMLTGSENMAKYDSTLNHTIVYQRNFTAPDISATDYLNDIGINGYTVLNIDGNKTINISDTAKLLKIISGIESGAGKDIDNDGKINITDVIKMQRLMFTK